MAGVGRTFFQFLIAKAKKTRSSGKTQSLTFLIQNENIRGDIQTGTKRQQCDRLLLFKMRKVV
jgi:hypothetical protein